MDHEKKTPLSPDDDWFNEFLSAPTVGEELGPDEQAVSAAGLTHPDDLEFERIFQEAKAMDDAYAEELTISEDFATPEEGSLSIPQEEPSELTTLPNDIISGETAESELTTEAFSRGSEVPENFFTSELPLIPDLPEELPAEEPAPLPPVILEEPEDIDEELPEIPAPKPKKKAAPKEEAPVRKVRPRHKKGYGLFGIPHILSTVIWLAIVLVIGVSLGRTLWVCAADVLAFGREDRTYSVTITSEDTMESIAEKLKQTGLIKYPQLFLLYSDLTKAEEDIEPGTYTLNSLYDYHALVKSMNNYSSARQVVTVVIPEGYTCAQIFALLEEKGVCAAADLEAYAAEGEIKDYWFLEGIERGDKYCLEGYLFPDTYQFYVGDSAGRVLGKLLGDNVGGFEVRFTDMMQEKLAELNARLSKMMKSNGYNQAYIDAHQMTIRDVVIVASMIEEETTGADQYDISSVIYNRLTNAGKFPYLNIDATIIYALGGNVDPETGDVMPLTAEDLKLDHPYNTYVYKGMIPGPITNPGIASLLAALDPNDTNYHFYVYNPETGKHIFAKTAAEHDKNVAYVKSLEENYE